MSLQKMYQSIGTWHRVTDTSEKEKMTLEQSLFYCSMLEEEVKELREALQSNSHSEVADAIADISYFLIGFCRRAGISEGFLMRAFLIAHNNNMTKVVDGKVIRRESDGKIMKPNTWKEPDFSFFEGRLNILNLKIQI